MEHVRNIYETGGVNHAANPLMLLQCTSAIIKNVFSCFCCSTIFATNKMLYFLKAKYLALFMSLHHALFS